MRMSKWTPPEGQFAPLDFFIKKCRHAWASPIDSFILAVHRKFTTRDLVWRAYLPQVSYSLMVERLKYWWEGRRYESYRGHLDSSFSLCDSLSNMFLYLNHYLKVKSDHLHFIIIATQSTVPLSYSLIYIGCVKRLLCKFVRNHSLIRYSLHCDWLLPSTDLKGHSRLRWLCKPINAHDVPTHHLTCVTHESKSPTALHIDIPILAICRKFFTMDLVKRRSLRRVFYRLVVERPKCYLQLEGLIEST